MEAVDPVFQAKMLDMLKQTGRPEMVVGWYHSHPGFGCWLSGSILHKVILNKSHTDFPVSAKTFCVAVILKQRRFK